MGIFCFTVSWISGTSEGVTNYEYEQDIYQDPFLYSLLTVPVSNSDSAATLLSSHALALSHQFPTNMLHVFYIYQYFTMQN